MIFFDNNFKIGFLCEKKREKRERVVKEGKGEIRRERREKRKKGEEKRRGNEPSSVYF